VLVAFAFSDLAYIGLAIFLVAVGLTLGYAFLRLGETFGRLSAFIRGTEREFLPVITKVGGSVDRVNAQLDKVDQMTDSAVDAADAVDQAVRTVSFAVKAPVQKLAGLASGLSHGVATLRRRRSWSDAVERGKEASRRRQADLEEELRHVHH
jgi:uncharacterized protein YoxC